MQTVRDDAGNRYLLLKRSSESSLVRDPATGETRYVENERLDPVEDESALVAAVAGIPAPVRRALSATHDDRSLGLLVEIVDRGPVGVTALLSDYDLCESDLHGLLAEFRAAGLIHEAEIPGDRGYEATETAASAIAHLRDDEKGEDR